MIGKPRARQVSPVRRWNCKPRSRFEEPDAVVRDGSNPRLHSSPRKSGAAIPCPLSCRLF